MAHTPMSSFPRIDDVAARLGARWQQVPGNARGAIYMLIAGVLFSAMSATVKTLGARYDIFEVAFFRCLFGLVTVSPFMVREGVSCLRTNRPGMHLARGVLAAGSMFCGFYALTHLTLADATAIGFTKPMFLIVLAYFWLGESVRWRRWTATAVGFCGVLVMVRPGLAQTDIALALGLLGTFLISIVVVLVKKLSASERQTTMLFYFGLTTTCAMAIPAFMVWRTPTLPDLGLLCLLGFLGATAQSFTFRAYRSGEATVVVPFDYGRLLFAGIFGYVLFSEVPDQWSIAGAVIIVGATVYIALRESQLGRAPTPNQALHHPVQPIGPATTIPPAPSGGARTQPAGD
jgi:drug/metabolite transporter (DMT)-like permease